MTLEEVKAYLRVDSEEDDGTIRQMMDAAESYIVDAAGRFDGGNSKARMLYMALMQDLYDNRTLMVTEQQRKRMSYTYASILLQLQYQDKSGEEVPGGESIRED